MKPFHAMPGPKGHLIFGHIGEMRRDMLGFFTRIGREFPELARSRFLHLDAVSVHTPELIEQVLVREHARTCKSRDFEELRHALGEGLVTSEGELWKRQRKLIQPAFRSERIRAYGAVMSARTERRMARWSNGAVVDIHAELSRITLEIVSEALFGIEVDEIADVLAASLDAVMLHVERLLTSWVPLPLRVPTPNNLELRRRLRRLDEAVYALIERRRAHPEADRDDLLGRMLAATDELGGMSDRQLRDELVTLLLAGHETTAIALTFAVFLLAQHPAEFSRLAEEVDTLVGVPTSADVDHLPYTHHVVDEAMRLYPPVWAHGREVTEPFELGGYELPKGTQLFMSSWVTHRDPRYFDDPLAFRPDRWTTPSWPTLAYSPFGAGPRKCIGVHFARMEAALVLATLVRRYAFELVDDPLTLQLMPSITLRPRGGLRVRLRAREHTLSRAA
ncbi:cytochrome P450 [Haliangium sp.]|uniref:cytochrome P450 n=1 Tax=Haliangium sp. TaxID=2663208 RepID=UPI003D0EAF6F